LAPATVNYVLIDIDFCSESIKSSLDKSFQIDAFSLKMNI